MSDEFVKLLRNPAFGADATDRKVMNDAADRIEGLKANLAKLATAVDALETIRFFSGVNAAGSDLEHIKESVNDVASKALAELKGQNDD